MLFYAALKCLMQSQSAKKIAGVHQLSADWKAGLLSFDKTQIVDLIEPARPTLPLLVSGKQLAGRNIQTAQGKAALLHAVTHIEFTAINLALDAIYRFSGMPQQYYSDWIQVAVDEAKHFELLAARLQELGYRYGDFNAHPALWDMAQQTRHNLLHRMALVPKVLEARGLDVTPGMIKRFKNINDNKTVDILNVILVEEISHVKYGNQWFQYLCQQQNLDEQTAWFAILEQYLKKGIYCPVNITDRLKAGFSEAELTRLKAICNIGRH